MSATMSPKEGGGAVAVAVTKIQTVNNSNSQTGETVAAADEREGGRCEQEQAVAQRAAAVTGKTAMVVEGLLLLPPTLWPAPQPLPRST